MDIKYLVVKQEVQECKVSIEQISTDLLIATPLTKGLPPKTFNEHLERMGVIGLNMLCFSYKLDDMTF